jgi:hypothetical protein
MGSPIFGINNQASISAPSCPAKKDKRRIKSLFSSSLYPTSARANPKSYCRLYSSNPKPSICPYPISGEADCKHQSKENLCYLKSGYALCLTNCKMLMVEFMCYPIKKLAEIKPFPADIIPAPHPVRDKLQPESGKFEAFWMPDQVRHDDFGF